MTAVLYFVTGMLATAVGFGSRYRGDISRLPTDTMGRQRFRYTHTHIYIYIYMVPPPPRYLRLLLSLRSMNPKTWVPEGGGRWKLLVLPMFSMISQRRQIMENVGFTNISNNFRDFPNYGSGSRGFPKIMELVGFTNIFREAIMENVGFTNISKNFRDFPNYGSGSRVSRKSWKLLVLPTFSVSQSWKMLALPTFPTISVIVRTMALAQGFPENHGNCWFYQHFP